MWRKVVLIAVLTAATGCSNFHKEKLDYLPPVANIEQSESNDMNIFEKDEIKIELIDSTPTSDYISKSNIVKISNETEYGIIVRSLGASVNGVMIDNSLQYIEVDSNSSVEESLELYQIELDLAEIAEITSCEVFLKIASDYEEDLDIENPVKVCIERQPGIKMQYGDIGQIIYKDENIKLQSLGLVDNGMYSGPTAQFLIENNSDNIILIDIDNYTASFNGEQIMATLGPLWIFPHTVRFFEPYLILRSDMQEITLFETTFVIMDEKHQDITRMNVSIK